MRFGRSYLAGSVSALVLSAGVAWAQDTGAETTAADADNPETLIQVEGQYAAGFDPENVGTAIQQLEGMSVSDIENMGVFDVDGNRIGTVRMVAENENGAVFVIVATTENDTGAMWPGDHAIPLTHLDYVADAEGLVMRDWATMATTPPAATGTAPGGYPQSAQIYSVLESDETIQGIQVEAYLAPLPEQVADDTGVTTGLDEVVGDSRRVLEAENVTDLEGRDILSVDGESIAAVEAVAYDDQGELYLIARYGGFLGLGQDYRAVSLDAFNYSIAEDAFIFTDGGQQSLEALPAWDYDQPGYTVVESDLDWEAFQGTETAAAEPAIDEQPMTDTEQAATDEQPMTDTEQAATDEQPMTDTELAATDEQPMTDTEQAATDEQPMTDTEQALTDEQPMTDTELAATDEQPMTGTDQAAVDQSTSAEADVAMIGDARRVLEAEDITDLEGVEILSREHEEIATVEAVAYDDQGQVYLIATYGGFLGLGAEYRAVSLDAFNYSIEEEAFIFTEGGEASLQSLPEWDYDVPGYTVVESDLDWIAFNEAQVVARMDAEAGSETAAQVEPAAGAEEGAPAVVEATPDQMGNARQMLGEQGVTRLEGLDIVDAQGEDIGTVDYIAQDANGELYVIVSLDDGLLGIGDSQRVVSLSAFDYWAEEEALVLLDVSEASLEAMPEWSDDGRYTIIESDMDWTVYQ
ncbi:MAG: PRC-barrel domain-containing protein [Alphaproteobacteria bacterium]